MALTYGENRSHLSLHFFSATGVSVSLHSSDFIDTNTPHTRTEVTRLPFVACVSRYTSHTNTNAAVTTVTTITATTDTIDDTVTTVILTAFILTTANKESDKERLCRCC